MLRRLPLLALLVLMTTMAAVFGGAQVSARPGTPSTGGAPAAPAALAAPLPLASTELASPAVTSAAFGRTDLFYRSSSGTLIYTYRIGSGSWTQPSDLGGDLKSQPAAVSRMPGRIDVFVRGTNDALQHLAYMNGRWSSWETLGGVLTSAPAVTSWGPDRLDVFVRGRDDALYHKWFASKPGWSPYYERLGGRLTSSPTATSWGNGRIDVFARGGLDGIYHKWFDRNFSNFPVGWLGWERLGGTATSQPAAASPGGPGVLDVFIRGTSGAMQIRSYDRDDGWTDWQPRGGQFDSGPSATDRGDEVRVVGHSPDGPFYYAVCPRPGARWGAWIRIS